MLDTVMAIVIITTMIYMTMIIMIAITINKIVLG